MQEESLDVSYGLGLYHAEHLLAVFPTGLCIFSPRSRLHGSLCVLFVG